MPGADAPASRALAVGNAEQAASRSKAAGREEDAARLNHPLSNKLNLID